MRHNGKRIIAGIVLALSTGHLSAQQTQPGGTTQPGTTQPGATQPGATQPGTTQPGTGQPGTAQPGYYRGMSQSPWFSDPGIRKQLNLNDTQFNQLNKNYSQYWSRFNSGISDLGTLNDQQRSQKMQDLFGTFNQDFSKSTQGILNKEQMSRYNQLYTQYRGYDSLLDPQIQQKLTLTDAQRERLNGYSSQYHKNMGDLYKAFPNDKDQSTTRYNEMRKQVNEQINSLLTDEQRRNWTGMVGDPYRFQPSYPQPTPQPTPKK